MLVSQSPEGITASCRASVSQRFKPEKLSQSPEGITASCRARLALAAKDAEMSQSPEGITAFCRMAIQTLIVNRQDLNRPKASPLLAELSHLAKILSAESQSPEGISTSSCA